MHLEPLVCVCCLASADFLLNKWVNKWNKWVNAFLANVLLHYPPRTSGYLCFFFFGGRGGGGGEGEGGEGGLKRNRLINNFSKSTELTMTLDGVFMNFCLCIYHISINKFKKLICICRADLGKRYLQILFYGLKW